LILSAGLTPAWQHILVFDAFRAGEVNRAREAVSCAAGKVLNVGIAAHQLGTPSLTLSAVGESTWRQITEDLDGLGVQHRFVRTSTSTRTCTTILDRATGTITELVENGRPLTSDELDEFRHTYSEEAGRADVVVLAGSLPTGTPVSVYRQLTASTTCPMVLDFRGEGLLSVLDLEPYVIKPNREELESTLGIQFTNDDELVRAMRTLNERGARWVVVTQGAKPTWITSIHETYRLHPPAIRDLVNPIASGDAMAATIAWASRAGRSLPDAVCLALAAAAQNARQLLLCRIDPNQLEAQANLIQVEHVRRTGS